MVHAKAYKTNYKGTNLGYIYSATMGRDDGCFICHSPYVELHHIYPSSRRAISDREGATVFLCHQHHQGRRGVHSGDRSLDRWLKADCQRRWMEREGATADDFRKVFYASYVNE